MLRVVRMSGKYYGFDMSDESDREKMKQIEGFLDEGTPVILVNDLSDLESFTKITGVPSSMNPSICFIFSRSDSSLISNP